MTVVTQITRKVQPVGAWYVVRDTGYLNMLLAARALDLQDVAAEAGVTAAWIGKVFAGRKCRRPVALSIVRQLTGEPDALEVEGLFQRTTRMSERSSAKRLSSGPYTTDGVPR